MSTRVLEIVGRITAPLALAISALLFLQWPLRDVVGAGSTQANDLAQGLFALYVAVAVTHAQRRNSHLVARPDVAANGSRWRRTGAALATLPWSLYLVFVSWPVMRRSLAEWERFPETLNPGYFIIKVALVMLGALLALQSATELLGAWRRQG